MERLLPPSATQQAINRQFEPTSTLDADTKRHLAELSSDPNKVREAHILRKMLNDLTI